MKIMALNPYFANSYTQGSISERDIYEDMIMESIDISGQELYYIPREYVAKNEILGEDRLSTFTKYYSINCYFESVDGFDGEGAFAQKFGYMIDQSATLVVSKKKWEMLIGETGETILPNRPAEGDLLYFPLTKGLFEIKFVNHQEPFFQIGRQYVYKLRVELYRYSSEEIDTGLSEIDIFEDLKTHDINLQDDIDVPDSFGDNNKFKEESGSFVTFNPNDPFGGN